MDIETRYKQHRYKATLKRLEEIKELSKATKYCDERIHREADQVIVQFLRDLGFFSVADAWEAIEPKWYG